jgi:hypothetical protein
MAHIGNGPITGNFFENPYYGNGNPIFVLFAISIVWI